MRAIAVPPCLVALEHDPQEASTASAIPGVPVRRLSRAARPASQLHGPPAGRTVCRRLQPAGEGGLYFGDPAETPLRPTNHLMVMGGSRLEELTVVSTR